MSKIPDVKNIASSAPVQETRLSPGREVGTGEVQMAALSLTPLPLPMQHSALVSGTHIATVSAAPDQDHPSDHPLVQLTNLPDLPLRSPEDSPGAQADAEDVADESGSSEAPESMHSPMHSLPVSLLPLGAGLTASDVAGQLAAADHALLASLSPESSGLRMEPDFGRSGNATSRQQVKQRKRNQQRREEINQRSEQSAMKSREATHRAKTADINRRASLSGLKGENRQELIVRVMVGIGLGRPSSPHQTAAQLESLLPFVAVMNAISVIDFYMDRQLATSGIL